MFTWICPVCGREVPPSYTECPDCAETNKTPAASKAPAESETPGVKPDPPPPVPRAPYLRLPDQPASTPAAPSSRGLPTWVMSIVFALAFGGIVAGAYFVVQYFKKEPAPASASSAAPALETPKAAPASSGRPNPLLRQIEISGLRLTQSNAGKTEVRFLVVNHSGAEISDLTGTVGLQARTSKKDEEPVGTFAFKIPVIGPYESKDATAPVDTKLKVYELPDWQNLDLRIQITSPQ